MSRVRVPFPAQVFFVYILQSEKTKRFYIGATNDIVRRIIEHNNGHTKSTKYQRPWKIVHLERYSNEIIAKRRERKIKSYKGGYAFKALFG